MVSLLKIGIVSNAQAGLGFLPAERAKQQTLSPALRLDVDLDA
jgi:hypothetical protein